MLDISAYCPTLLHFVDFGCFHILAINDSAVNISFQVTVEANVFISCPWMPGSQPVFPVILSLTVPTLPELILFSTCQLVCAVHSCPEFSIVLIFMRENLIFLSTCLSKGKWYFLWWHLSPYKLKIFWWTVVGIKLNISYHCNTYFLETLIWLSFYSKCILNNYI